MNPNAYGAPPPANMQQTQAFHQQATFAPGSSGAGWTPNPIQLQQQQQPPMMGQQFGGHGPTSANMPGMPPQQTPLPPPPTSAASAQTTQPMINGNYQQQLATSMNSLTMNPMKQQPQQTMTGPPQQQNPSFINANTQHMSGGGGLPPPQPSPQQHFSALPTQLPSASDAPPSQATLSNGPLQQGQGMAMQGGLPPPPRAMSPTAPNNNYNPGVGYTNGQVSKPPTPAMYPAPNAMQSGAAGMPTPQSVAGGHNQMSINSANMPGLPHMPPPKAATPSGQMPPMTVQSLQPNAGAMPQPTVGMPGPGQYGQQQMPPRPGQMPLPPQQQQQQQQMMPPPPLMGGQMQPPQMQATGAPPGMPGMPPMPPNQMPAGYPPQQPLGYPLHQPGYPGGMMPPQAGYNQPPAAPSGGMYPNQQQSQYQQQPQYQQQQRRLDPDQMPNPIQVMIENQRIAGGPFVTNQAGLLPPLVTTKFTVQDQGNSSPRFIRSSVYSVPATADLLKTTALPFTLIVSPYARTVEGEFEPPIVDFGELGPIRCNRCKAYMSPNMQFVDAGRRFQCLMCKVTTEVATEYFQHLDHAGQRVDKYERPELVLGTYEFLATKDYCRNNLPPEIPAFIFIIDVSYNTIKSGLVHLLCSQVKEVLRHLPIDQGQDKSKVRVGFITYNSTVHFYNIKSSLAQPQMMVVGDVQDMFMPLLDGFLCNPEESEAVIDALMEQIPKMFLETKETETILYPAIQAGLEALKASNCAGKLLVFNSTLPIAEAPGKLKNRDDRKLLGTDKEKTVLTAQCTSYNTLGQECVQHGCSVDLFLFNNTYIDIATIGQVSRLTGGEVYKYTYFQADTDGKRLIEDIIKNVSRPIAFDAVMRVRTSAGIRATDFYGHFFMTNTTDVELASVDATKSIAIEIKHDDKLPTEENVYLQIALLYTSCSGQRRLRILNLALTATTILADVFKSCDLDAMMLFFAKQACTKLLELTPKQVKDNLINRSAQILACYRKHCSSPTSAGQLILPECLKLLPLYVSCLLKNDAICGGSDMTLDDRSYVMQFVLSMDLNMSVTYLYPRFMAIHNVEPDEPELPKSMRCTFEKMSEDGAFILENGVYLFIWLGQSLPQTYIQPLFGVQCTQQVNAERFAIVGDTPLAQRVRSIIEQIMQERTRYMRVTCVRQNDKLESVFRHFLVEDRGTDGSASYVDFLCHMHKEIKDLLS